MSAVEVKKEETPVTTVVDEEISDVKIKSETILNAEEEIGLKKSDSKGKKSKSQVIGDIG